MGKPKELAITKGSQYNEIDKPLVASSKYNFRFIG